MACGNIFLLLLIASFSSSRSNEYLLTMVLVLNNDSFFLLLCSPLSIFEVVFVGFGEWDGILTMGLVNYLMLLMGESKSAGISITYGLISMRIVLFYLSSSRA